MTAMNPPDDILLFIGYALAHAAYSVCDVPMGELLIPFVISEVGGTQELIRFEAESQDAAIAAGKKHVTAIGTSSDLWCFVRESMLRVDETELDVLSVDAGRLGLAARFTVVQPFRPNEGHDEFALLPGTFAAIDGEALSGEENVSFLAIVRDGIRFHPEHEMWEVWLARGSRDA